MPLLDGKNLSPLTPLYYLTNAGDILAFSPPLDPTKVSVTDGASAPQIIQSLYAVTGDIFPGAVGHDSLWRGYAWIKRINTDGTYQHWQRTMPGFIVATEYFLEMMRNNGVDELKAQEAYRAVSLAGQRSFSGDAAMPIPGVPDINSFEQPICD